jgi:hypothetical protein
VVNFIGASSLIPQPDDAPAEGSRSGGAGDFNEALNQMLNEYQEKSKGEVIVYKGENYGIEKEESIPLQAVIEKEAYKYPNQNLEIKIRDSRKVAIKRIVYGKSKSK